MVIEPKSDRLKNAPRPLGATVGDLLDKPLRNGGLALSRPVASIVLAAAIVLLILILRQRPERVQAPRSADQGVEARSQA